MAVDFHWHAREWGNTAESVAHSLLVAHAAGLDAIAVIGNTNPPLVTPELCVRYHALAPSDSLVQFFVHGGLTSDTEQIKRIVEATRQYPWLIGLKMFWDHSTGNLGITREDDQHLVMDTLAKEGYTGVLVCHFEEPWVNDDSLFDLSRPRTWSELCRPESSEIASFRKGIKMAKETGFKGKIHVAHVSTREVVDYIHSYSGPLQLSCGITPHHALLDNAHLDGMYGVHHKCNPPLRSRETQEGLLDRLLRGKIPILESDHAPHSEESKRGPKPPSGLASGTAWPFVLDTFRRLGMDEVLLTQVSHHNACGLYGVPVELSGRSPDFEALKRLQGDYAFDPFTSYKRILGH